jgi:glycosyltransferase involved in cell wall biosynthesis
MKASTFGSTMRSNGIRTRVILLAFHFPPDPSVGSIRAGKVATALAQAGHKVHVIAPRLLGDDTSAALHEGVVVHRIRILPNAREILSFVRSRLSRTTTAAERLRIERESRIPEDAADGGQALRVAERLKRNVLGTLFLPDDRAGYIAPAAARAASLARGKPAVIYSTAPPFSVHVAALLAKNWSSARWIAEFRDPWQLSDRPRYLRSAATDWLFEGLRARCLHGADQVVAVTETMAADLSEDRRSAGRPLAVTIRNGIDFHHDDVPAREGYRIGYFGHLYLGRDPRPLLHALGSLRRAGELPADVSLHFYGNCRYYYDVSVEASAAEQGVGDLLHFHGDVPREACLQAMRECDLLLLFAQQQPKQVPNKLYEYLGSGRRILAFVDADGETSRMLRRVGGHHVLVTNEAPIIATELKRAIHSNGASPVVDEAVLREWSTQQQMQRITELVDEIGK